MQAGQVQHGLAQRLGRDRAGVDADPADHAPPFDHRDLPAELGGGDGGLLAAGAGPEHEQVDVIAGHEVEAMSENARSGALITLW